MKAEENKNNSQQTGLVQQPSIGQWTREINGGDSIWQILFYLLFAHTQAMFMEQIVWVITFKKNVWYHFVQFGAF